MQHSAPRRPSYNVELMLHDMTLKGWLATDLADKADVSDMTVSRFLKGIHQTPPTAKKLARALGHSLGRYVVAARRDEAVA
jgi:transcriptional regulator with XRE-family HTH domain